MNGYRSYEKLAGNFCEKIEKAVAEYKHAFTSTTADRIRWKEKAELLEYELKFLKQKNSE